MSEVRVPSETQTEFNLRRWEEILADRTLRDYPGKIETDRYGNIIASPAKVTHFDRQFRIGRTLEDLMAEGRVSFGPGVSTREGNKIPDVSWRSWERVEAEAEDQSLLTIAPEICVEILSRSNTGKEMHEKRLLYLSEGAQEVWLCDGHGEMTFYYKGGELERSSLCPEFPKVVELVRRAEPSGKSKTPVARENDVNRELKRSRRSTEPAHRETEKPDPAKDKSPER
jgi:Uma2 family endonuclease